MTSFANALAISIAIHAMVAIGLAFLVDNAPHVEIARLDLTTVELSFSDEPSEAAPPSPMPMSAPGESGPEPKDETMPEIRDEAGMTVPPEVDSQTLPEPSDEPVERMETPAVAAPAQARIDGEPPKLKSAIRPEYPKASRMRKEEGDVLIEIFVGADGLAESADVIESSGYPELDAAALKAALGARFTPAKSGGRPVGMKVRLPVSFRLY